MRALLKTGRNAASLLEMTEITLNKTGSKPRATLVEEGHESEPQQAVKPEQ